MASNGFDWIGSAQRYLERAVAHGYPERELKEAVEKLMVEEESGYIMTWMVEATRLLRKRKAYKRLPILDEYMNIDDRYAKRTPPEGGFETTLFRWEYTGKMEHHSYTTPDGELIEYDSRAGEQVPMRTATGLPLYRDVIGRFLAHMKGGAGEFTTDGHSISSYSWRLAFWRTDDDGVERIYLDDHMFGHPWGPTTSGHMSDVRRYLWDRAANKDVLPEGLIRETVGNLVSCTMRGGTMADVRKCNAFGWNVATPWEDIFARARPLVEGEAERRVKHGIDLPDDAEKKWTKASIVAYTKWLDAGPEQFLVLFDAYRERMLDTTGKKFGPVPNRLVKEPTLVKREDAFTEENGFLGWWFNNSGHLGYGDNRPVVVGETHSVEKRVVEMCQGGLHASPTIREAYSYVNGRYLYRTLQWGKCDVGNDKIAAQHRRYLAVYDTTAWENGGLDSNENAFAYEMRREATNIDLPVGAFEERVLALMGMTADQRTPVVAVTEESQTE